MQFSMSSLLNTVIFSNLLLVMLFFIFKNMKFMQAIGRKLLAVYLVVTMMRLAMPIEFNFTVNIYFPTGLSEFIIFLKKPLISVFHKDISIWYIFVFVWIIGIMVSLYKLSITYRCLKIKIFKYGVNVTYDEPYHSNILKICRLHKRKSHFRIYRYPNIETPMIFGLIKPYILIPDNLDLEEQEIYYILSHEAVHFFHYDLLLKFLTQVICSVYWWNPFVPSVRKQISVMLEMRVDHKMVSQWDINTKTGYMECLLKVAKDSTSECAEPAISFCNSSNTVLSQRFHMILDDSQQKINRYKQILFTTIILGVYLFSVFVIIEPYFIETEHEQLSFDLTSDEVYLIKNPNGGYDIYAENQYIGKIDSLNETLSNVKIYKNKKEVK